jgi:hypothetical protein
VGPNELPTQTSYVGHKTSTDRSLRNLHDDWPVNFGSHLAFEISTALYATELNAYENIPSQITLGIRLRKDCSHCLKAIDGKIFEWTKYPKPISMGNAQNPYVGFTEEQRKRLIEQINLKLQSLVEQMRIDLSSLGSHGQYLAFKTTSSELIRELSRGS